MKNKLVNALEPLGFPVYLQGAIAEDEPYPDSFFTFWNSYADGRAIYDNEDHATEWEFVLAFYSTDPDLVNTVLLDAKRLLKSNSFSVFGRGYDLKSDEPTHTGRGILVRKYEV